MTEKMIVMGFPLTYNSYVTLDPQFEEEEGCWRAHIHANGSCQACGNNSSVWINTSSKDKNDALRYLTDILRSMADQIDLYIEHDEPTDNVVRLK